MNISHFIKEIRAESKHITWPSRKTTTMFTLAVIILSFFVGYYLGFFDFVFSTLLGKLL